MGTNTKQNSNKKISELKQQQQETSNVWKSFQPEVIKLNKKKIQFPYKFYIKYGKWLYPFELSAK